jgi:hypothetical protein
MPGDQRPVRIVEKDRALQLRGQQRRHRPYPAASSSLRNSTGTRNTLRPISQRRRLLSEIRDAATARVLLLALRLGGYDARRTLTRRPAARRRLERVPLMRRHPPT